MKKILLYSLLFTGILTSCLQDKNGNMVIESLDPHSYSQPSKAIVEHLKWDASINFEERMIDAVATWTVSVKKGVDEVIFDTDRLVVKNVRVNGEDSKWKISQFDKLKGTALIVELDSKNSETAIVSIEYRTPTSARALFWAAPEQTFGKRKPFLFTQSQAILARTWLPCQDSPGIRFTYDATVKVPEGMMALMSAENPQSKSADGVYTFKMDQPIPAYLMALAVGDIEFSSLGSRTGVYAEPGQLPAAAEEFSSLEKMVVVAEELYGPYSWGRYDVLVLPPSFPFGGMENPRLTFATPTIIAGDKSLVSLIAHELAHSWSGNLVTNETWDDFWLNEGFTVYFEMRIMENYAGKDYADMLANLGYSSLLETVEELGPTSDDTKLKLNLEGRDPDVGMTDIAYEKGYYFLKEIEELWGRNKFDSFLRNYFQQHKFMSMSTESFLEVLEAKMGESLYSQLKVDAWVYGTGIPSGISVASSERFNKVDEIVTAMKADSLSIDTAMVADWSTHEWLRFIGELPDNGASDLMAELDAKFGISNVGNAEILCAWYEKGISNNYAEVDKGVESFLTRVGRRKFLSPLYKGLVKVGRKDFALKIYEEARPGYHAVAIQTIDKILGYRA